MSSTRVSSRQFVTVRGRGYRPKEVDAYVTALSAERDAAWERVARLAVLAKGMAVEAKELGEAVTVIEPQTYDSLGERARSIFQLVQKEATGLVEEARREAQEQVEQAEARAAAVRRTAEEQAEATRAQAKEHTRRRLLAARAEAHGIRVGARRQVKEFRGDALAELRKVRQGTASLIVDPKKVQADLWAGAEQEAAEQAAALDAQNERAVARAEEALAEAQREVAAAEEASRRRQEEAAVLATQIVAEARLKEERITRETERVLREHGERWDEVQAHMDQVQQSLRALTGGPTEDTAE